MFLLTSVQDNVYKLLTFVTAWNISLNTSSDRGKEKSTPLISAAKVGCSSLTEMRENGTSFFATVIASEKISENIVFKMTVI
jgi:hypothetical protein